MDLKSVQRDLKKEITLAQAAEFPNKADHSLLFGVIVDVTEPQKYEEKDNYTVSLKVIDPSFNYQQKIRNENLKFHKFVKINVYGEDPKNLLKVSYIGDIIRIRRFKFVYTKKGALTGNMQKYSNWLIYPGANFKERDVKCDPWVPLYYMNRNQNKGRELFDHEKGRLEDLRKWSVNFFQQNSLQYIDWWNNFKQTEDIKEQNDVDLFLKIGSVDPKKRELIFYDIQDNQYKAVLPAPDIKSLNHVCKMRCVNVKLKSKAKDRKQYTIKLTIKSSCLYIPSYSMDYQKFFQKISDKNTHSLLQIYDWLANYNLSDIQVKNNKITPKKQQKQKIVTTYKKIVSAQPTPIKELKQILNKPALHKNERFTLEGRIVGFSENNPQKFLKVMAIQSKKFFDYDSIELGPKMDRKYRVFIHLQVQVMDDSVESPMDIYISTTEGDHHLFETWENIPPSDKIEEWSNLPQDELDRFKTSLQQLKKPGNKVKLCLQLKTTANGKSFYKLVDTIFLPL